LNFNNYLHDLIIFLLHGDSQIKKGVTQSLKTIPL
jgi:hypothetical protein